MNLPDSPNTGYKTIEQKTQAGTARKFLPAAGFFTRPGEAGRIANFFSRKEQCSIPFTASGRVPMSMGIQEIAG